MTRVVRDVMTKDVVVVSESAPFKEIVRLMEDHRVSALPVLDDEGYVVGIVSEADLLLKERHLAPVKEAPLFEGRRNRRERAKAEGLVAGDVMTSPVITIGPTATLAQAAWKMQRVKRLPVVDDRGALVGIVSRADLLTVFLRSDEEIKGDVIEGTIRKTMWIDPDRFRVTVDDGIVTLEGQVERISMIPVLVELVKSVDGVVGVDDRLSYEVDDVNVHPEIVTPWGIYSGALRPGR